MSVEQILALVAVVLLGLQAFGVNLKFISPGWAGLTVGFALLLF